MMHVREWKKLGATAELCALTELAKLETGSVREGVLLPTVSVFEKQACYLPSAVATCRHNIHVVYFDKVNKPRQWLRRPCIRKTVISALHSSLPCCWYILNRLVLHRYA